MKKNISIIALLVLIICLLQENKCMGQTQKAFKMVFPKSKSININENYSKSTIIYPFTDKESIYSLSVSAKVQLNGYKSLVRVVLVTESGDEYLVLESYYMLEDQKQIIFNDYADETALLNGVESGSIRIEIEDATILLESVSYNNMSENKLKNSDFSILSDKLKKNQDSIKIDRIRTQIKKKGYHWEAGKTTISELTYRQKKNRFGNNSLLNLRGFEYYRGGIFDLTKPKSETNVRSTLKRSPMVASEVISSFNWCNRHGQNWMTSVKNQQWINSCVIFAITGAVEALANLYYNQHLDMDLSEQNLVSCARMTGDAWSPLVISYEYREKAS